MKRSGKAFLAVWETKKSGKIKQQTVSPHPLNNDQIHLGNFFYHSRDYDILEKGTRR